MSFLNTIIEYEGPVVDVRPRYWAAHKEAVTAVGFDGPTENEFWRLFRTGAADSVMVRYGKDRHAVEYGRLRDERIHSTELMDLDEPQPGLAENLRVLKQMGACHLVTTCSNREGINATLDRLDVWIHFEQKRVLPENRDRRVDALKELAGPHRATLAVAGTVPFAYAAGEAGCRVVGLESGPTVPKLMRQVGVDLFFESLDNLTEALVQHDPELRRIGLF